MFDAKHIAAAIARLSLQSSRDVKLVRDRAESLGLDSLVSACDAELAERPFEFTEQHVARFEEMASLVRDADLTEAIEVAFTKVLVANSDEVRVLQWWSENPGGAFKDAEQFYGKGDLALVVGHLVYDRYGCFRKFMNRAADKSSVILLKDRSGPSVRYTLKPEADFVFRKIGVVR